MNTSDFKKILKLLEQDLQKTISDTLPRKAGVLAVNHTRQNFRDGVTFPFSVRKSLAPISLFRPLSRGP